MKYKVYDPLGNLIATFNWIESWNLKFEGEEDVIIREYWDNDWGFEGEDHIHYEGIFHDNLALGARKIENLEQFGYIVMAEDWKEMMEETPERKSEEPELVLKNKKTSKYISKKAKLRKKGLLWLLKNMLEIGHIFA